MLEILQLTGLISKIKKCCVIFLILSGLPVRGGSQSLHIPPVVDSAFAKKAPGAVSPLWSYKYGNYEVAYQLGQTSMKTEFSAKGEWLKTETKMSYTQLPPIIVDSFKLCRFSKIPIKDVIKTELKNKHPVFTIVTMKGTLNKTSLMFSEDGHLLTERNFL